MDPSYSERAESFRKDVRAFLERVLPADWQGLGAIAEREEADRFVDTWRATLAANGFLGVQWPREYGGAGLSKLEPVVLVEELARAGVPSMGHNDVMGVKMLGNTLLRWGTEEQKRHTDATTSAGNVVGEVNQGWTVAMTLLGLERGDDAATNPILFRAELDRLVAMAKDRRRVADPVIRDRLADAYIGCEVMRFIGLRILTGVLDGDGTPGNEASISKLYWSRYHQRVARLAVDVLGADALVVEGRGPLRSHRTDDPGAPPTTGRWLGTLWNATAGTIYAGASEVQRNIIAERVLGLPKDRTD